MDPKPTTATAKVSSPTRIPPPRGYALSGKIMLAAIVVLFSIVLLILFVHLYARFHLIRRRRRLQRRRLVFATGDGASASASPRGLDPAVLSSLAVEIFSPGDAGVAECAVCLSEFEEGEKVRVLPRCDHRFHIECIDMWFGSHNSCPLCRTPVEIEPPQGKAAETERQCADLEAGSSSDSSVSIEISDRDERLRLGFGFRLGAILAAKRFWSRDREVDLERGRSPSTTPPATPQATMPQATTPAVL